MGKHRRPLLIVSLCARALATSAHRAGFRVRAVDLFCDDDTRNICAASRTVPAANDGFDEEGLMRALAALDPMRCAGIVYGSGFDGAPAQLERLGAERVLLGNVPGVVRRTTGPAALAGLLTRCGIPHPEVRDSPPADVSGWLVKRAGASGGAHVRWLANAKENGQSAPQRYFQRFVPGQSISMTLLADGRECAVVGFSRQWCADVCNEQPFTYAGAVTLAPCELARNVRDEMRQAARLLVRELELRGLCTLDAIVDGHRWSLLELNPRPGATFELHDAGSGLFAAHLGAVEGRLPTRSLAPKWPARGHGIVYARHALRVPQRVRWPDWITDRPCAGATLQRREPVCTVHANGRSSSTVSTRIGERRKALAATLSAWSRQ